MFSFATLFLVLVAVIGSTSMMGVLAYLFHRIRLIEAKSSGESGSQQLIEQLVVMEEELRAVQGEMTSLTERLDFTEKLLMSGDDGGEK
jgi:hypothetical protein